jgi:hypothetical protein
VGVGAEVTALVDHIVRNVAIAFNVRQEERKERWVDEEF